MWINNWNTEQERHRPKPLALAFYLLVHVISFAAQPTNYGHCAETDDALKQKFLDEAPASWAKLSRHLDGFQGKIKAQVLIDNELKQSAVIEHKFNQTGKAVIEESLLSTDMSTTVFAANPRYAFIIRRKAVDDQWLLVQVEETAPGGTPARIAQRFELVSMHAHVLTQLCQEPLADVVKKKNFALREVRYVQKGDQELVEITFDYPNIWKESEANSYIRVQGGSMLLDPKRLWCVRESNLRMKTLVGVGTCRIVTELSDYNSSFPIPKKWETSEDWVLNKGGTMRMVWRYESLLAEPRNLPNDDDFRLTAFGLPEPIGVEWKKPTPRYVWLLVGAGVFAILAVGFRYFARRSRHKPT